MNRSTMSILGALAYVLAAAGPGLGQDAGTDDTVAAGIYRLPSKTPARAVAVVYSGDGGWQDLDKVIGEWLSTQDLNVVGVSTIKAFWETREPPEVAATFERLVAEADPSGTLPILVVGYSFGADIFPFAWPELRPDIQNRIKLVGLLALSRETGFHVSIEGWLGLDTGTFSVVDAMKRLPPGKVLCVYGEEEEDDTGCKPDVLPGMAIERTTGEHHFDGDYIGLGKRILAAFEERLGEAAPAAAAAAPAPAPAAP